MRWTTYIALRYFKARKKDRFVNITSQLSFTTITLSIIVLIVTCAVIRGFEEAVLDKVLKEQGHIAIIDNDAFEPHQVIHAIPKQLKAMAIIETSGILTFNDHNETALIKGVEKTTFNKLHCIESISDNSDLPKVAIGMRFAKTMGIRIGDKIELIVPVQSEIPFGIVPEKFECIVTKIVKFSLHDLNRYGVFMELSDAQKILGLEQKVTKIICFGKNATEALKYVPELQKQFYNKIVYCWKDMNMLFADLMRIQKNMITIILIAIICLAASSIACALILFIHNKKREIGILKLLNASKNDIISVFIQVGLFMAIISSALGISLGLLITTNLDLLCDVIYWLFQIQFFDPEVYLLPAIPISIHLSDILIITFANFCIIFLAILLPAYKTMQINTLENID